MQICSRCVLPETFPGIAFDSTGVCSICRSAPPPEELLAQRRKLKARIDAQVATVKGRFQYDCLVAFSGGKDSSFTLKFLSEEYDLTCLAVTIDNGFISEQARRNCEEVTRSLAVDWITFRPAPRFMEAMYRTSATAPQLHTRAAVTRASGMCNSCINLINAHTLRMALQLQIPIIAGGYIGGQVPKDAAVLEVDPARYQSAREAAVSRYVGLLGGQAKHYYGIDEELIRHSAIQKVVLINPMLAVAVSEEEIVASIHSLGWRKTKDTGANSSNCRLNDLAILVHHQQHGFNPYVAEIAEQVRMGLMQRAEGLRKAEAIPARAEVAPQARQIGLDLDVLN